VLQNSFKTIDHTWDNCRYYQHQNGSTFVINALFEANFVSSIKHKPGVYDPYNEPCKQRERMRIIFLTELCNYKRIVQVYLFIEHHKYGRLLKGHWSNTNY